MTTNQLKKERIAKQRKIQAHLAASGASKYTVMIHILGGSGSGKDTLVNTLLRRNEQWMERIVTCTTRPMRPGEVDGVQYHFVNEEYLKDSIDSGNCIELREYEVLNSEIWRYFTEKNNIIRPNSKILVGAMSVDQSDAICNKIISNELDCIVFRFALDVSKEERENRLRARNGGKLSDENRRRLAEEITELNRYNVKQHYCCHSYILSKPITETRTPDEIADIIERELFVARMLEN